MVELIRGSAIPSYSYAPNTEGAMFEQHFAEALHHGGVSTPRALLGVPVAKTSAA